MSDRTVETIDLSPTLRVLIEYDDDHETPESDIVKITYRDSSRYVLGTEPISDSGRDDLQARWDKGEILALPVYAYVHSRATIRCSDSNPFDCQWDSGQSGIAYITREDVLKEWGKKIVTAKARQQAFKYIRGVVEEYDQHLTGDVYGYVVQRVTRDEDGDIEDTDTLDSCWGFYGMNHVTEDAMSAGKYQLDLDAEEAAEQDYWAARGVATV